MNVTTARAILTAHGLDSAADADVLMAAIEARGWTVQVERHDTWERPRRYRVRASRPAPDTHPSLGILTHLSAAGPRMQTALVVALGKILTREEPPAPRRTLPVRSTRR